MAFWISFGATAIAFTIGFVRAFRKALSNPGESRLDYTEQFLERRKQARAGRRAGWDARKGLVERGRNGAAGRDSDGGHD